MAKKIVDFDPSEAFPDCNYSYLEPLIMIMNIDDTIQKYLETYQLDNCLLNLLISV